MSEASDLIERMEKETGQRIDDNDGDNFAMAGLIGAMARALGTSQHQERDDVAAGVLVKYGRPEDDSGLAALLAAGLHPDEIHEIGKALK